MARGHCFPQMIWMSEIQHRVAQGDHRLLVLALESSGQGTIPSFYYDAVSHPLPELGLCGPELLSRAADYKRRLLFLFYLLCAHNNRLFARLLIECTFAAPWHSSNLLWQIGWAKPYPEGKPLTRGGVRNVMRSSLRSCRRIRQDNESSP